MFRNLTKHLLVSACFIGALMSCSKKEELQPASSAALSVTAPIKVVDGRLVFANQQALDQTRAALRLVASKPTAAHDLAQWESALHFTSLRAAAATEESHLEALVDQGQPTPAHELMTKFGFPAYYAALISPAGEYQVGDKVYWFHDKFKYQATTPTELAAIKQNPAGAKVKYTAGASFRQLPSAPSTNRTIAGNDPYCDDRYSFYFQLNNDPGSSRRTIYGISVYAEDDGEDVSGFYHYYYTTLTLYIKFEYYANRHRAWYPVNGQTFNWQTSFSYDATPIMPDQINPAGTQYGSKYQQGSYDVSAYAMGLASANIVTTSINNYDISHLQWDFEINGSISGYPTVDTYHTYTVNASPLW